MQGTPSLTPGPALTQDQLGQTDRPAAHFPPRQVDQNRGHRTRTPGQRHPVDAVGAVFTPGQRIAERIGPAIRQGIDGRPARVRRRSGIGMDRDEQIGMEPPRDPRTLFEREEAVPLAGERHAHPPVGQQRIAQGQRKGQRQLLLAQGASPARARIMAAVPSVDHHQRTARVSRPLDPRQVDRARSVGQDDAQDMPVRTPAFRRPHPQKQPRPERRDQQRHHEQTNDDDPLLNHRVAAYAARSHARSSPKRRHFNLPGKCGCFHDTVLIAALQLGC